MWPGEYPIGRGLGGTSAVNGGVLSGDVARLGDGAERVAGRPTPSSGRSTGHCSESAADAAPALLARRAGRRDQRRRLLPRAGPVAPNLGVRTGVEVDRVLRRGRARSGS